MVTTIKELQTLKPGDYIEASELYYKVLKLNARKKKLVLTHPFSKGYRAEGSWTCNYTEKISRIEQQYWNVIRQNSAEAKGIERKLK